MRRLLTPGDFARLAEGGVPDTHASIATVSTADADTTGTDRIVRYLFSTSAVGRDMHTVAAGAWQLDNFRSNPVFLWAHDDKLPPIGRVIEINAQPDGLKGAVRYAERDISPFADSIYRLVKGRYLNAVSVSWLPVEWSRSMDRDRPGGLDFSKVDLLEISQVPLPASPEALATARGAGIDTGPIYTWLEQILDTGGLVSIPRNELNELRRAAKMTEPTQRAAADWKVGAAKDLPVEDSDAWDGAAAEASIFAWAGGDKFDSTDARRGFLVYNAAEPDKRGSYKLPIAHVVDGELKVPKGAIRAAASRLSQTDIPADVKERAESVLDAYKRKAGIGDSEDTETKGDRSMTTNVKARKLQFRRGLYECAQLAYLLQQLCGMHDHTVWEEAAEGDEDSQLPQMLGALLKDASDAFLAMTKEEVEEMLEEIESAKDDEIPKGERAFVAGGKSPRARAWRSGIACLRAGKALSAANAEKLEEAQGHHDRAAKHHRSLGDHQKEVADQVDEVRAIHSRTTSTLASLGYDNHEVTRGMEEMGDRLEKLGEAHDDARDTHSLLGRSVRCAQRCVASVLGNITPTDPDAPPTDSKESRQRRARAIREGSAA